MLARFIIWWIHSSGTPIESNIFDSLLKLKGILEIYFTVLEDRLTTC